ncbi:MAG: hypothetical protein FWC97_00585 [Treponema sp.]|nr:hypothetical protein [Treponema sp.]
MRKVIHIIRYGTVAEKIHLERTINTYDYLIINGNSAAFVSRAIAQFVVEKFFTQKEKRFIIDPITYAFQQNIDLLKNKTKIGDVVLKKSIKKLIENYGEPATKILDDNPIRPADFSDTLLMDEFCFKVLDFQYSIINKYINNEELNKYLEYASELSLEQFHPKLLIAPYFYLNHNDPDFNNWLDRNIQFLNLSIKHSKNSFSNLPVFGQIVINKNILLNEEYVLRIIEAYNNCDCSGINIWVDGLDEHEDNQKILTGFINFLSKIKRKEIYNMYGGFFSILLTHKSLKLLSGVSHGMEYGENREVYPVGGGIPVSKYYYYPLHQRKDFSKAYFLLRHEGILDETLDDLGNTNRYYSEICECPKCKNIMGESMSNFAKFESTEYYEVRNKYSVSRRKKPTAETKENCLHHYLLCKKIEFDTVRTKNVEEIIAMLQIEKEKYINCKDISNNEFSYIDNWCNSISEYLNERRIKKQYD